MDADMALQRFPSFLAPTHIMEMMEIQSKDVSNMRNYNASSPGNECHGCKELMMHLTGSLTTQRRLFPSSQLALDVDEAATRLLTRMTRKERRMKEKMTDLEKLADQQGAEPIPPR